MDLSGIREIRKRIDPSLDNFKSIYGCYVNLAGDVISKMELSILDMSAEEKDMYSKLLKKSISGSEDKNLFSIDLPEGDVQASLFMLSKSKLENDDVRNAFYDKVIESLDLDKNYCILLASDTYDVKSKNVEEEWSEESESQFTYFLCAICPIKETKAELKYMPEPEEFRSNSTGSILTPPVVGVMYPSFVDRGADIYNATYYISKDPHSEFVEGFFKTDSPKTADEMKEEFHQALQEALAEEYNVDTAAVLYSDIYSDTETEAVTTIDSIIDSLNKKDVSQDKIENLQNILGEDYNCNSKNLINKKYEIKTSDTSIITDPENALRITTREIDGKTYILVPVSGSITVDGAEIEI